MLPSFHVIKGSLRKFIFLFMKLFRIVLWVQTIYYFLTAAWGLIDIKSFMLVTGPKTDVWLVKTVSVLLLAVSFCFITNLIIKTNRWPVIILAVCCCIFLAGIDIYYAGKHVISAIYFVDSFAQVILLIAWIIIIVRNLKESVASL